VYRSRPTRASFTIHREPDGWRVVGQSIERAAAMTYWEYDDSVRRFQRILHTLRHRRRTAQSWRPDWRHSLHREYELEWQD